MRRSESFRLVNELGYTWFDFDCDYCTGVYDADQHLGLFHHTWSAASPPPNPNTNLSVKYNYTDNPNRTAVPGGDHQITVAWDNLSEITPDPKTNWFDFRGYKLWKVANWQRPVGSPGPGEDDWSLIGEYRLFRYRDVNRNLVPEQSGRFIRDRGLSQTLHSELQGSGQRCVRPGDRPDLSPGGRPLGSPERKHHPSGCHGAVRRGR